MTNQFDYAITPKVTKKLQKEIYFISRLTVKIISAVLSLMFVFGSTISVYAYEISDIRKVNADGMSVSTAKPGSFDVFSFDSFDRDAGFTIKADSIGETYAVLSWVSDSVILSYRVCIFNPLTKSYDDYDTVTTNEIKVTSLTPATRYQFCIKSQGSDDILGAITFRTANQKPLISVSDVSSKEIELSITNVADSATVAIYKGNTETKLKKIGQITGEGRFVDTNVKEARKYYYKVQVINVTTGEESRVVSVTTPKPMGLPAVSGSTKTYAYYTAVTAKGSPQYRLLNSAECTTDEATGIRMYDGCYCVALGSYYGSTIGTKYRITLSTGKSFMAILCDQKANRHTDGNNQYAVRNRDVVEFYVQKGKIPAGVRGDYGHLEQFKGNIVSIEKFE